MPKPILLTALLLVLLAGCAAPPPPAPKPVVVAPPTAAEPEAPAPPPEPPRPATAAEAAQAQKMARGVIDLLEAGREDEARAELERALALDASNKLAQNLMKQITADPVATLGRDAFNYTVRPTDTLSRIAGRFLNDIYAFYLLARYNDIKVPRAISSGQTLRIPGKAPPAGGAEPREAASRPAPTRPTVAAATSAPAPAPAPAERAEPAPAPPPPAPVAAPEPTPGEQAQRSAEAAERAGQLERALAEFRRAADLGQAGAQARADAVRKRLIERHSLAARTAFAKQDLAGAIAAWDRVLALDAGHDLARLERQKAVQLQQRADALK